MTISKTAQQHHFLKSLAWGRLLRQSALFLWRSALWMYTLIVLGLTLFLLFDRTNISWVEFFKTGVMLGLVSVLPVLIMTLILRYWRMSLALAFPALFVFSYYAPFFVPSTVHAPDDAPQLTVLTFNILQRKNFAEDIAQVILESGADVVAVQELSLDVETTLSKLLHDTYPYQALHPQTGRNNFFRGQGVYSRFPIVEDNYWQFDDFPIFQPGYWKVFPTHGHQRVVLRVDDQNLVLYNTHLWPAIDWAGGLKFDTNNLNDYGHSEAARRLVERTSAETLPLIWVGDFNMSDQFAEYDTITAYLTDSFRESGTGMGYTYPAQGWGFLPPLMRLDYIFHSDALVSVETHVLTDYAHSDHRPVMSTLALVGNQD